MINYNFNHMEKRVQKFDVTIQATNSKSVLSLKGVDYDYFLKAYSDYVEKLYKNEIEGNYIKSMRNAKHLAHNPLNNINTM
jgi:hypothetical protein